MGIFGALTTAVTGMRAQSFALENVSGNIANSQTTAFKRMDTSFVDLIPDEQPSKQLAGNVVANSRSTNTVQGDIQTSSIGTFMAINGDGFFVIQKPSNFVDNRPVFDGIDRYTRRGDFQPDKNGFLVNGAGYYLMGIPVDPTTGNLVGSVPQLLQFQNDFLPAQATTQIEYRANLASYPLTQRPRRRYPQVGAAEPGDFLGQSDCRRADRRKDHRRRRATRRRDRNGDRHRHLRGPGHHPARRRQWRHLADHRDPRRRRRHQLRYRSRRHRYARQHVIAAINGMAGLSAAVTASIDTSGGTNKLRLDADSADFDFAINAFSTDALTTRLGLSRDRRTPRRTCWPRASRKARPSPSRSAPARLPSPSEPAAAEVSTIAELTTALGLLSGRDGHRDRRRQRQSDLHRERHQHDHRRPAGDRDQVRHQRVQRAGRPTGR